MANGDFTTEIEKTQLAAQAVGRKIYGWSLDAQYRDTGTEQAELAAYALANDRQAAFLCSNDELTKEGGDESCIAAVLAVRP